MSGSEPSWHGPNREGETVIFRIAFEEIAALNSAAERLLTSEGDVAVVAPPEVLAEVESRLPLEGDFSVGTLAEQRRLLAAVDYILDHLKRRMDAIIADQYVGSDDSVNAYFDYANVLTIRLRLIEAGREMAAMVEVMIGGPVTAEAAESITFPD
ncbi:MAG TPA: hypothetical protein VMM12_07325 [Longimicrobiales bacterium]|nr:hypothetical protein [Longimicrobiales bacterium]